MSSLAGGCVAGALCSLAGCNTGSLSTTPTTPVAALATGIWVGTDATTGLQVTALINAAGNAVFVRADGVLYSGSAQVSGSALAASVTGYSNFGTTFADGADSGVGTVNGTVTTTTSLDGTLAFTTSAGTSYPGNWSLSYSNLSTRGSALSTVTGNYVDANTASGPNQGASLSIGSSGALSSNGASSGCSLTGTVTTADTTTNVYEVTLTYQGCTGSFSALNGVALTGLAVYNGSVSPNQMLLGVSGQDAAANKYGLSFALDHN